MMCVCSEVKMCGEIWEPGESFVHCHRPAGVSTGAFGQSVVHVAVDSALLNISLANSNLQPIEGSVLREASPNSIKAMADIQAAKPFTLDAGTLLSLGVAFSLMPTAQLLAAFALPKTISTKYKFLFLWHAYDFLTHFIIEGSYLYHCFFSYAQLPSAGSTSDYPHPASLPNSDVAVLFGHKDRRYGAHYSTAPMARLWQEYAKADHRWGGADLTVISLEILTVGLAGPAAVYICYLIYKIASAPAGKPKANLQARLWFL